MTSIEEWRERRREDPRPRRRYVDRRIGSRVIRSASGCLVCGKRTLALEAHHIVPRSQGGDDVIANLVALCGPFEPSCHRKVTENDPDTLRALRRALSIDALEYVIGRKGAWWLDSRYPLR